MRKEPAVAIGPNAGEPVASAVRAGGGRLATGPEEADAIVWLDPTDPGGLRRMLESSGAVWVQLPFAGIESFFEAGVITAERTWTCAKGIYGESTAEHALALILTAARRLHEHVVATSWRPGFGQLGAPEQRLAGATVLIVGTGGIGSALTRMLTPLGPRVVAVNRSGRPLGGADVTVPIDRIHDLLPEADYVVLAVALTPSTRRILGAEAFEVMKPSAWVVNVARGALVDTNALVAALDSGTIAGAALDVTDPEPLPDSHPLWSRPNCIITPHVANTADMAVPELIAMVERNVRAFARGDELEGLVDVSLGY